MNKYAKRGFGARPKVARKRHLQKSTAAEAVFKKPPGEPEYIKIKYASSGCSSVNLFYQDESRFGLLTLLRRMITVKGVKPKVAFLHRLGNLYLFGAFSPFTGLRPLPEMPHCNSGNFQLFLHHRSTINPTAFNL